MKEPDDKNLSVLAEAVIDRRGFLYHGDRMKPQEFVKALTEGIYNNTSSMYGKGMYCVRNLDDALENGYGPYIYKLYVRGFDRFLHLDKESFAQAFPEEASRIFGKYSKNLKDLDVGGTHTVSKISKTSPAYRKDLSFIEWQLNRAVSEFGASPVDALTVMESIKNISGTALRPRSYGRSSVYTSDFFRPVSGEIKAMGFHGVSYTGRQDRRCCLVYDFNNLFPVGWTVKTNYMSPYDKVGVSGIPKRGVMKAVEHSDETRAHILDWNPNAYDSTYKKSVNTEKIIDTMADSLRKDVNFNDLALNGKLCMFGGIKRDKRRIEAIVKKDEKATQEALGRATNLLRHPFGRLATDEMRTGNNWLITQFASEGFRRKFNIIFSDVDYWCMNTISDIQALLAKTKKFGYVTQDFFYNLVCANTAMACIERLSVLAEKWLKSVVENKTERNRLIQDILSLNVQDKLTVYSTHKNRAQSFAFDELPTIEIKKGINDNYIAYIYNFEVETFNRLKKSLPRAIERFENVAIKLNDMASQYERQEESGQMLFNF